MDEKMKIWMTARGAVEMVVVGPTRNIGGAKDGEPIFIVGRHNANKVLSALDAVGLELRFKEQR